MLKFALPVTIYIGKIVVHRDTDAITKNNMLM